MRDQRLDTEVVTIEVVTMVDVEIDVVVVEDVDEELVVDVVGISVVVDEDSVDDVVAAVVDVDSVEIAEDAEDETTVAVGMDVADSVDITGIIEDEIAVVLSMETVDSVDITGIVEDEITVVAGMGEEDTVGDVVDTVRVELSIGKNLTALTPVILEITPATARKRISDNAIRTATDFIQLSLLPQNRMAHFLPRACVSSSKRSILTTTRSYI